MDLHRQCPRGGSLCRVSDRKHRQNHWQAARSVQGIPQVHQKLLLSLPQLRSVSRSVSPRPSRTEVRSRSHEACFQFLRSDHPLLYTKSLKQPCPLQNLYSYTSPHLSPEPVLLPSLCHRVQHLSVRRRVFYKNYAYISPLITEIRIRCTIQRMRFHFSVISYHSFISAASYILLTCYCSLRSQQLQYYFETVVFFSRFTGAFETAASSFSSSASCPIWIFLRGQVASHA